MSRAHYILKRSSAACYRIPLPSDGAFCQAAKSQFRSLKQKMNHKCPDLGDDLSLHLSDVEIDLRKRWLELSSTDEALIADEINRLTSANIDELMDNMYRHFLSFEETRTFFTSPQILERAKSAQAAYFRRLTQGNYDAEYVKDRLCVGATHNRVDLDPKWYLGAYNHALGHLLPLLIRHFHADPDKLSLTVQALLKVIFFDMGLAIESYINAKEFHIKKHRDAIREFETERKVTKNILESAPIGIVTLSNNLVCIECNDEFANTLEAKTRLNVLGRSLFDLAPRLRRDIFEDVVRSGQPSHRDADLLRFANSGIGDERCWDWAAWPIKDDSGAITGVVAMFVNVTDRVQLQQQREDFVATLTHDLKTPVSATNRAVQYLLEGDFGPISQAQQEVLKTIHQSNTNLYSLVQTLLDVYRFDSGVKELHNKNCNIAAIITQVVTEIMPLAQEKGVQLEALIPGDATDVVCDGEEIRRVVQNLIDNSLKFTPSGGTISVTMSQKDGKTQISVVDSGKGVPEENKPKLFQRFWQAGSTGRYYASTGLGLYLCRRIIEAHGGRIWCESTLGKGSKFSFEI